jgi:hypothetical protein
MAEQAWTQEEVFNERQCVHRRGGDAGVEGNFISGKSYVAALQRLKGQSAQRMALKVGAFFWRDAPNIKVWLCRECEAELKL